MKNQELQIEERTWRRLEYEKAEMLNTYSRRLKTASQQLNKHSIRAQKKRDWERYSREI